MRRSRFAALTTLVALSAFGQTRAAPIGQWLWSARDLGGFERAQHVRPELESAVHVADLVWKDGASVKLRLSPASDPKASAIVVRLERSFDPAWGTVSDAQLVASLAAALGRVISVAQAAGFSRRAIQLDYDCPVRLLPRYAKVLRGLSRPGAVLAGWELWITTLAAHLREPSFGALFAGAVSGHIVQLFDTGERFTSGGAPRLVASLERAALPFCVGIGAFERAGPAGAMTDHLAWADSVHRLSTSPLFRGTWVFAAGLDWSGLTEHLP